MIERKLYLQHLEEFIDKPFIKIITGIRRCGKSTVMLMLRDKLIIKGIKPEQITYINFESFNYSDIQTGKKLYEYISSGIQHGKKNYLLLDEIQEVEQWEKCINSLLVDFDTDIYLTGSNSHILSSEMATYLAGRYVEIPVYTLSFEEYLCFISANKSFPEEDKAGMFYRYLRQGGFPVIHTSNYNEDTIYKIVFDIYSSIILRDTVQRYKIRDVELLERVIKFAFDNIGNTFSGKNVADYFKSQQRKIDINTVYNYLHALEGAFIVYRLPRYDIKGKEILKTQEKFYLSDVSLLYATMGYKDRLIASVLENIVFLELKRRGYSVFIGKLDTREVDFVAEKSGERIYVQVAYKMDSQETVDREFSVLLNINDQFPKYVVSMDDFWKESVGGVQHFYIADFLLNKKALF
ncbi:MAG TPA: ATP-binding protein [Bacteroidales bacterium]|nr:ATP-binding protein [Bacteroidales bacterium]HQI70722.1 ATP-binding protein [Bacteroidales bacterium]